MYLGIEQFERLILATKFYEFHGFQFTDVPWAVSREALDITTPPSVTSVPSYVAGEETFYPVASAEQSFIQMKLSGWGRGRKVALTPCFRSESIVDDLHWPYFMKVELIDWDNTTQRGLNKVIEVANTFFSNYLKTEVIPNTELNSGEIAYDIVSKSERIELGSYGIREYKNIGRWVYGTGCAEPRLTSAIEAEEEIERRRGHSLGS